MTTDNIDCCPRVDRQASLDLDEDLWDSGQEWILIFDNLLKHPRGRGRGCKCDMCLLDKNLEPDVGQQEQEQQQQNRHHLARSRSGFNEETLFPSLGRKGEVSDSPGKIHNLSLVMDCAFPLAAAVSFQM